MAKLIVVWWRDIPSQVLLKRGRETTKALLAERFQVAIDSAAMRAGKGGSAAYLAEWRREQRQVNEADSVAVASHEARRLEALYTDEDLLRLVRAKGVDAAKHADESLIAAVRPDAGEV